MLLRRGVSSALVTVVIGGMITQMLLMLFVLPAVIGPGLLGLGLRGPRARRGKHNSHMCEQSNGFQRSSYPSPTAHWASSLASRRDTAGGEVTKL